MIGLADSVTSVPPVPLQVRLRFPALSVLVAALVLATVVSLTSGAYPISPMDVLSGAEDGLQRTIFTDIRVPRVVLAGFVGAALALSGAALTQDNQRLIKGNNRSTGAIRSAGPRWGPAPPRAWPATARKTAPRRG